MKKKIFRCLSFFCGIVITLSSVSFTGSADEPLGRMASLYAYALNNYLFTYGSLSTEEPGGSIVYTEPIPMEETEYTSETNEYNGADGYSETEINPYDTVYPTGVVYSDIINFDSNGDPYLVIFLADGEYASASCHVWKYNEAEDRVERIAILDSNYLLLSEDQTASFELGLNDGKKYIIYKVFENNEVISEDYYTAIDGEAFHYVNTPLTAQTVGIMDFSGSYFHPGIDVSQYNLVLNKFFDKLKNTAADSVTYEDIAERFSAEDEAQIEEVLKTITGFVDFDIAEYASMEEYREALNTEPNGDRFYLISEAYNLGDEIYYIRFSTDRSYYNYALLLRSDDAENGYQILKVKTDCIPLSDRELKQIKTDYDRNTLLYKKSKGTLKLSRHPDKKEAMFKKEPLVQIEKIFSSQTRLPIVCVGGGVAIALLTILWVYMYSDSE